MREELNFILVQKRNPIMADKLRKVRRSYSSLICRESCNSWCRCCSKAESAREVSTLVQIVGNNKVIGISLLGQGDNFAISAEVSLDFLLKLHLPMHLPLWEEVQDMED